MGVFIPLIVFGALILVGVVWIVVWQIRSGKAEVRRWIDRK